MRYNPQIHNRRSMRLKNYDYSQKGAYFITICCNDRACLFGEIINGEMILNANGKIAYYEWLKTTEIRSNVELDVFVIMPNHIHGIIIINNQMHDTGRGVLHTPVNQPLGTNANDLQTPCLNMPEPQTSGTDVNNLHTPINQQDVFDIPNIDHSSIINQGVCNTPQQKTDGRDLGEYITPSIKPAFGAQKQGVCNTPLRSNGLQTHNFDTPLRSPSNTVGAIVRGYKSAVTSQMNMSGLDNYNQSSTVWQRNFHDHIIRDEKEYQTISNYIVNNPLNWNEDRFYKE